MNDPQEALNRFRRFIEGEEEDGTPQDRLFGEIAVAQRFVTFEQFQECFEEQKNLERGGEHVRVGQILLRHRYMTSDQFLKVLKLQKRNVRSCSKCDRVYDIQGHPEELELRCLQCGEMLSPPGTKEVLRDGNRTHTPYRLVRDSADQARLRLGKYALVREIARGGMGVVFEAKDTELGRRVALKILREGEAGPSEIARLHREAAIAAQLQHPNIVGIHEVGMIRDGTGNPSHFIVMDYIEGGTLAEELTNVRNRRRELLAWLGQVVEAIAYAHSKGVIHRDLKPGNILIAKDRRVLLTDFGLARSTALDAEKLTRSNAVMGTPHYMAPEQVRGLTRDIGEGADIYALGVLLYEILVGRQPFVADTPAALFPKILEEEAEHPRRVDPTIEPDLEVICLKAMAKERERRYATAEVLLGDLRRFRNGEPITARPASLFYRIRKGIARRKAIWTATGLSFAVLAVVGVTTFFWIRNERKRRHDMEEQAIVELSKRAQLALEGALELRRAGSLKGMNRFAVELDEACRDAIQRMPGRAEPHYLRGRMLRAQMRYSAALEEQERALAKNSRFGPALYERIYFIARLYDARVNDLWNRHVQETDQRPTRTRGQLADADAEARRLRVRIEDDLRRLEGSLGAGQSGVTPGELAFARGFAMMVEGEIDAAYTLLANAARQTPTLEELYEALASIELSRYRFEQADHWISEGLRQDQGYLPLWIQHAEIQRSMALEGTKQGRDPVPYYEESFRAYERCISLNPGDLQTRLRLAHTRMLWGNHLLDVWSDPTPVYKPVLRAYDELIELSPTDAYFRMKRGVLRINWGIYEFRCGRDPFQSYESARRDFQEAMSLDQNVVDGMLRYGRTLELQAEVRRDRGEDPIPDLQSAIACYDREVDRKRTNCQALRRRGVVRMSMAVWQSTRGRMPDDLARQSFEDLTAAVESSEVLDKGDSITLRGEAYADWGERVARAGGDPTTLFRRALYDYEAAIRGSAGSLDALVGCARVHRLAGGYFAGIRPYDRERDCRSVPWNWIGPRTEASAPWFGDPKAMFSIPLSLLARALQIVPAHPVVLVERANVLYARARLKILRGEKATEELELALRDFEAAIGRYPSMGRMEGEKVRECRRYLESNP